MTLCLLGETNGNNGTEFRYGCRGDFTVLEATKVQGLSASLAMAITSLDEKRCWKKTLVKLCVKDALEVANQFEG